MIVDYFEGLSDKELPYLNTEKHKGKKAINHGEIISNLYPISGMPGEFVQVDNIIAVSESEGDFKKVVLDYPAEIQGLILGLVKTPLLEEDPEQVFKRMGIKDVPSLGPNQEYEFHLDTSGLSLKIVTLDENYRQLDSNIVWESTSWEDVKRLLKDFNLDGTFDQFIEKIKKFKNPRSKNRVKGFFKTSIKVGPAEKGTPKGDGKQQALDTVAALEEKYGSFAIGLIKPLLLEQEGTIAIFPGKFKPPHKDHLARIQAAAKIADQVRVIIGPNPVAKNDEAAISAQESLAIFDLYKKKNLVPDNVTFEISDIPSPVLKAYQEFEANPEQKFVAIFGKDDAARFKGLAKMPNVTINNFPEANIGDSSATDLRKAIAVRDIEAIKQFLPFGVSPSEYLDALNMPEKEPLQETYKGKRTKDGAPGTLKAKISKLYGGDVTIEKARKLKNRKNATPHDKRQANWFINFHSKNESITPAELKQADDFADSQLAPIDVDLTSKHVFDRLTGRESDISFAQLIGFFKRLGRNKKQFIDFFNKYEEIVANDKTTNLNIPFLNLTNKAIAKTIMRKPNFLSSSPKLTFEEEGKAAPYGSGYKPLEEELAPYIQDLTKHMYNQGLTIDPAPEIEFIEDEDNAKNPLGKTAYYDPNSRVIALYVTGRHPKDILRSFAHEMIHHCQNLEGRLGNIHTTNVNEDDYLKSLEREAYERGNMSFRSWENSMRGDNGVRYIKGFSPSDHNDEPIMAEGRYDSLTRSIVQDIIYAWKADYEGVPDELEYEEEYNIEDSKGSPFVFNLVAKLKVEETEDGIYRVNGGVNDELKIPYFEVDFQVDPRDLPKMWSTIYTDLIDVVRHELEHLTQTGTNVKGVVTLKDPRAQNNPKLTRPGKQMEDDQFIRDLIDMDLLPKADYFRLEKEVDAMLQGMYLKAKKMRKPFADVLNNYLDMQPITPEDKENILDIWRNRAKSLSLPKF
jgi:nicotinamide mononucleotide adenylyltransferase